MATSVTPRASLDDWGKLLLRLTVAGLLLFHGVFKVKNGIDWMAGPLSAVGLPAVVGYGVYVAEIVAPVLLIVGKYTRLAGLVIAFDLCMAILLVLRERMFTVSPQGGGLAIELELLFLLGGLAIALLGSGRYALSQGRGRWD
ncbi:MAG: DoxX family protein [Gemmatimonadaceae bacterium]